METVGNNKEFENQEVEKEEIDKQLKKFIQSELVDLKGSIDKKEDTDFEKSKEKLVDYMLDVVKGRTDAGLEKIESQKDLQEVLDRLRTTTAEKIQELQENIEHTEIDKKLDKLAKRSLETIVQEARVYYKKLLLEAAELSRNKRADYVSGPLADQATKSFGFLNDFVEFIRRKAA